REPAPGLVAVYWAADRDSARNAAGGRRRGRWRAARIRARRAAGPGRLSGRLDGRGRARTAAPALAESTRRRPLHLRRSGASVASRRGGPPQRDPRPDPLAELERGRPGAGPRPRGAGHLSAGGLSVHARAE